MKKQIETVVPRRKFVGGDNDEAFKTAISQSKTFMSIKQHLILLFILLAGSSLWAQQDDYKIYRDSLSKLSCKPSDSLTVAQSVDRLKDLDISQFHANLDWYYHDLGWAYFRLYMHNKDTAFVKLSIESYLKKLNLGSDAWNLAFSYFLLQECENGHYYLGLYVDTTPLEFRKSEDEIQRLTAKCED